MSHSPAPSSSTSGSSRVSTANSDQSINGIENVQDEIITNEYNSAEAVITSLSSFAELSEVQSDPPNECGPSLSEFEHLTIGRLSVIQPSSSPTSPTSLDATSTVIAIEKLRDEVSFNVLADRFFPSPFGSHVSGDKDGMSPLIFCDQTASNRPLNSIESYLHNNCLGLYGNTHTNTSVTGCQSTAFVSESRQIIAECVNARITGKAACDVVLFVGNGATSAVELLIGVYQDCVGLKRRVATTAHSRRPVIFVGSYEHHSNLLPWRESGCEVVTVRCRSRMERINEAAAVGTGGGIIDVDHLRQCLSDPAYVGRDLFGAFSAASNVDGSIADVNLVTSVLKRAGAKAFWDYATATPYIDIDMNPAGCSQSSSSLAAVGDNGRTYEPWEIAKDAVVVSSHKIIGGPGAPGVLIIKKDIMDKINAPCRSGGGTVFYVTHDHHRFLSNRVERYEGGTPNIIGIWRAGLCFLFKTHVKDEFRKICASLDATGRENKQQWDNVYGIGGSSISEPPRTIFEFEIETHRRAARYLQQYAPNICLLGLDNSYTEMVGGDSHHEQYLPILSFLVKCGRRFLHHNFVCALLNDLFGVQSRGGCQCAGPYSQHLLGLTTIISHGNGIEKEVSSNANERIESALLHHGEKAELLRPGYTRISLPFKGLRGLEVAYVLESIVWVARCGWRMMGMYRCNHRTGEWRHRSRQGRPLGRTERRWLSHYDPLRNESKSHCKIDSTLEYKNDGYNVNTKQKITRDELDIAISSADKWLDNMTPVKIGRENDDEDFSFKDSDGLEDLRWYVHPRECARWRVEINGGSINHDVCDNERDSQYNGRNMYLKGKYGCDNHPVPPGTDNKGDLVGPIRPKNWFTPVFADVGNKDSAVDGESLATMSTANISADEEGAFATEADSDLDTDIRISFRDGKHSGEASLDDIREGYNDGELSESTQIFDKEKDNWVLVSTILDERQGEIEKRENNLLTTIESDLAEDLSNIEDADNDSIESFSADDNIDPSIVDSARMSCYVKPTVASDQQKMPIEIKSLRHGLDIHPDIVKPSIDLVLTKGDQNLVVTKGDQKKPARGQTMWGKGVTETLSKPAARLGTKQRLKPPTKMMRCITQAMIQWDMINEGDRLLLGLSGGKDSLSLLHCLLEFQRKLKINFEIEVCTIDPMTRSFDPSPLIPYVESLGLKYHYIKDDIVNRANKSGKGGKVVSSLCAFCARMKRGILYECARKNNCNKLVLAQHLDDCAESFLMSVMHNGFLTTMKAHYKIDAGDISVIRPMVYCRENLMTEFSKDSNLPVINENCPACFEEPKERARIKKLLSREETLYANIYDNLRRSLLPLMHEDLSNILKNYTEETIAKSRKICNNENKKINKKGKDKYNTLIISADTPESVPISSEGTQLATTVPTSLNDIPVQVEILLTEASEEDLIKELAKRRSKI